MLKQRIITALILAPLTLAAVFFLSLPWFATMVGFVTLLGAWEWGAFIAVNSDNSNEAAQDNRIIRSIFTVSVALLILSLSVIVPTDTIWQQGQLHPLYFATLLVGGLWWLLSAVMVCFFPKGQAVWRNSDFLKGLFGQLTLIPFWVGLMAMRAYGYPNDPMFGSVLIVVIFMIVWGADVGAYFVGRQFGRRKLMPNVSPGKTIEGALGGIVTAVIATFVANHFFYNIEPIALFVIVLLTGLSSVFGDLSESMFKRTAAIKDSGNLLPGHGGILDRIDSLTAAVPLFSLLYLFLVV
ncbi:MAG: phosphatidate cytidylyltransferase [Gammaproteobacteria bacterium]|nr:phosphatidate cytidylyltransferase [Gammaproteobacteria bacterium]